MRNNQHNRILKSNYTLMASVVGLESLLQLNVCITIGKNCHVARRGDFGDKDGNRS